MIVGGSFEGGSGVGVGSCMGDGSSVEDGCSIVNGCHMGDWGSMVDRCMVDRGMVT